VNCFAKKELHPMDLKNAVAIYLDKLLKPVREKLEKSKAVRELAEEIKKFEVTR
jgi:tyrosyl-tRNA synthetase